MKYLYTYRLFENKNDSYIDDIVDDYIETMFFTSEPDEGIELDSDDLSEDDLSEDDLKEIKNDIEYFVKIANQYDDLDGLKPEQIGGNFWYSRNGHGTGFFDRDYLEDDIKDSLQKISELMGEATLYIDVDSLEYVTSIAYLTLDKRIKLNDIDYFKEKIRDLNEHELTTCLFQNNEIEPDDSYKLKKMFIDAGAKLNEKDYEGFHFLDYVTPKVLEEFKKDFPNECEEYFMNKNLDKFNI